MFVVVVRSLHISPDVLLFRIQSEGYKVYTLKTQSFAFYPHLKFIALLSSRPDLAFV